MIILSSSRSICNVKTSTFRFVRDNWEMRAGLVIPAREIRVKELHRVASEWEEAEEGEST